VGRRIEVFTLECSRPDERLDTFLRQRYPAVSRSAIRRLIQQGCIRVNGRIIKPTHSPRAGERIEVCWPESAPALARPEAMALDILYEDELLLVVNKPAGLVVHPAAGHQAHTLVNALLHHCAGQLSGIGGVARPGIVHRLDKDTSGCLVVAKTDEAHRALAAQFAGRHVEKTYHALVCGEDLRAEGELRVAIARHPSHRKRMAVRPESGREAHTTWRVVERLRGATLVEAHLHTGRTHQIRVHFQFLGHPLVGDTTYGARPNRRLAELHHFTAVRQMLHASRIAFTHPRTGQRLVLEAPWPQDFREAIRALRQPEAT